MAHAGPDRVDPVVVAEPGDQEAAPPHRPAVHEGRVAHEEADLRSLGVVRAGRRLG